MKKVFMLIVVGLIVWLQCSGIVLAQAVPVAPESFLSKLQFYFDILGQVFFVVMILATVLVQFFPGKKDQVKSAESKLLNILSYFPTLWKNPRTKALENTLKEIQDK
jgi:hypothetical protein